ncbi:MAG TPA: hypothetical protein P5120_03245 [Spirochaetota bacterium]|nr:hypothetical protein [Spirochaetota bacterium]
MKNNKVLIITDSVSMPRPGISYEDTWIYHLKQKYPELDIIDRPARGAISRRLVTEGGGGVDLLETYMPGTVIIQLGLAECAPRLFKKSGAEFYFMNKILSPALRTKYINYIKKKRPRKQELAEVPPEEFRNNLNQFMMRSVKCGTKVLYIKILRATDLYLSKSPDIQKSIDTYNAIIDETASVYDNLDVISPVKESIDINSICLDELHITKEGNKIYFKAVDSLFTKLYRSS